MTENWHLRIRSYRLRSGLTQEQLADVFMVADRTVRRWENGQSQPPQHVRERLLRTHVPLIHRPEVAALRAMTETSSLGTMLMDEKLNIIAMSAREQQFWLRQYGQDLRGQNWEPFSPPFFRTVFETHGGWRSAIKSGASSLTCDFSIPMPGNDATGLYSGRVQYTILRMSDGTHIHNYVATTLPAGAAQQPARLTFIDEIESE